MPVRHKDMFDELPGAIRRQEAVDWLTSLESFINLDFEKVVKRQDSDGLGGGVGSVLVTLDPKEKKKLENRRNCLRKFIEYIKYLQENQDDEDIFPTLDNSAPFLSKEELRKIPIYNSCIAKNSELFFLPTILQRIFEHFSKDEFKEFLRRRKLYWGDNRVLSPIERFNEWREFTFNKTRVYSPNKVFHFKEIDGLLLDKENNKVMILRKGKHYEMMHDNDEKTKGGNIRFKPKIIPNDSVGKILQRFSLSFPTMADLTVIIKDVLDGVSVEIEDKAGETKTIRLDDYRAEDFKYIKRHILRNIPLHKVFCLMPHLLLELYQFTQFVSPRLIVK